jgi:acyl-CoA thioesterase-1
MKRYSLILGFAFLSLTCDQPSEPIVTGPAFTYLPAFEASWNSDQPLICFGTSLTYGYGAGAKRFGFPGPAGPGNTAVGDSSYPNFLKQQLKIPVLNYGTIGAKINYALSVVHDTILAKKPALVLLEYGANDFLQQLPVQRSDSLLNLLVSTIRQHGVPVVLIGFIHPDMISTSAGSKWSAGQKALALEYHSMLKSVAARNSVPLIDDALRDVFGEAGFMSDAVHPNGAGYYRMFEHIYHALYLTFDKNGMLK